MVVENIVSKSRFAVTTCYNTKVVEKRDGTKEKYEKSEKYEKKVIKDLFTADV